MKKILVALFLIAFLLPFENVLAQSKLEENAIYLFSSPSCPYCTQAKNAIKRIKEDHDLNFLLYDYNISQNINLAKKLYQDYSVPASQQGLVPAIFIGEKYFIGFNKQIEQEITAYLLDQEKENNNFKNNNLIRLPVLGEVNLSDFSLPLLAITLGIVDGFNVCSLGALIIILGLVMILGSRRRIILLGGAFILTTAIIYGFLIFLWHRFFSLISPYIGSMNMLIGLIALAGGIYLLREFYRAYKSGPICSSNNLMSRLTPKIEKIFKNKTNWLALLTAVVIFAIIAVIVEFPCSAFLPVLFTSILVDSGVSLIASLYYISIYMFLYLLDEIIILLIAVFTLKIKIVSPKFIILFNLLAAFIFIFLGIYYLFNWLS